LSKMLNFSEHFQAPSQKGHSPFQNCSCPIFRNCPKLWWNSQNFVKCSSNCSEFMKLWTKFHEFFAAFGKNFWKWCHLPQ
jgi:hypothetical protein